MDSWICGKAIMVALCLMLVIYMLMENVRNDLAAGLLL